MLQLDHLSLRSCSHSITTSLGPRPCYFLKQCKRLSLLVLASMIVFHVLYTAITQLSLGYFRSGGPTWLPSVTMSRKQRDGGYRWACLKQRFSNCVCDIIEPYHPISIYHCVVYTYPIIQIIREISKKVSQIQNRESALTVVCFQKYVRLFCSGSVGESSLFPLLLAGLGEFRIRDLNDEINKLLREKRHWQDRILELGGPDYFVSLALLFPSLTLP